MTAAFKCLESQSCQNALLSGGLARSDRIGHLPASSTTNGKMGDFSSAFPLEHGRNPLLELQFPSLHDFHVTPLVNIESSHNSF